MCGKGNLDDDSHVDMSRNRQFGFFDPRHLPFGPDYLRKAEVWGGGEDFSFEKITGWPGEER